MAVLKQIKFGNSTTQIAMTQVAIDSQSSTVLGVNPSNTGLDVNDDPVYTISLAVDGKTIAKGANGLETSLALKVQAASGEGSSAKKARIALVDSNGGDGFAELSSVNIEDIVGGGIVKSAVYDPATGILTITWAGEGAGKTTEINLGALLDIQDIIIKDDSTEYLSFDAVTEPSGDAGQAQIGVKLADVTYTASTSSAAADLAVSTGNGKMLDASDAIPAIKSYVLDVLRGATASLAVTAEGDDYVGARVDAATDNKHVIVDSNVVALAATAGTPGEYAADGSQTTAPVAGTLSGTANSLADGADIATKVKTYVDWEIAIERARSDAKNLADIAALDATVRGSLDSSDAVVTGKHVGVKVEQEDGKLKAVTVVEDDIASAADVEEIERVATEALTELDERIKAMDKAADAVNGQVVTTVSEADGVVSETKANVKDLQLGGYTKDSSATGNIASTDTINAALSKLENKIGGNEVSNADGSITVTAPTGSATTTDVKVNIKSGEKVIKLDPNAGGIYTDLDIVKVTTGLASNVKECYRLLASDDTQIGQDINIYKDSSLYSVYLGHVDDTITSSTNPTVISGTGDDALCFIYQKADGTYELVAVNVEDFLRESEFADGLQVNNEVVSVKVDTMSEKDSQATPADFLSVSSSGVKVQGIKAEIDRKIAGLDVTTDAAVAGQYVAAIEETDGIVAVKTRANVSEAVLNNYSKGSDRTAVAATDTVNQAISKLENKIDAAATVVAKGTDAGNNMTIAEATDAADGHKTYTINLTDVASKTALDAEIAARKAVDGQNGQTYAANSNANYISAATSLNDADVKLDAALKVVADKVDAIQYRITGTTLEFFGMTEKSNS